MARRSSAQSTMSLAEVAAAAAMDAGVAPKGQFPNGDGAALVVLQDLPKA